MNQDQILKIARFYYLEDVPQKEISRKLNISIATVSRSLALAKKRGLVEIKVKDPRRAFRELEISLERAYGLKECIVVPSSERPENILKSLAAAMDGLLPRVLGSGGILGVSWGETLKGLGEALSRHSRLKTDVVPIIGAMGKIETGIYPNAIAQVYASKLGGRAYLVNTPALVDTAAARKTVIRDSHFTPIAELWSRIDTALLSVSSVDEEASVYRSGIFSRSELASLRKLSVVCATNFNFLDIAGNPVPNPLSDRLVNLGYQELREIGNVIIAAFGRVKVPSILSALKGKTADILLTDEETASLCLS
jgi:DNA-binding transcriptional regulator LsrR (DeoR family)